MRLLWSDLSRVEPSAADAVAATAYRLAVVSRVRSAKMLIDDAAHAMEGAINPVDGLEFARFQDKSDQRRVDDGGGGAAALGNEDFSMPRSRCESWFCCNPEKEKGLPATILNPRRAEVSRDFSAECMLA
jgi:hypothetical protein